MSTIAYGVVDFGLQLWKGKLCSYGVHAVAARVGGPAAHGVQLLQPLAHLVDSVAIIALGAAGVGALGIMTGVLLPILATTLVLNFAWEVRKKKITALVLSLGLACIVLVNASIGFIAVVGVLSAGVMLLSTPHASWREIKGGEEAAKKFLGKRNIEIMISKMRLIAAFAESSGDFPAEWQFDSIKWQAIEEAEKLNSFYSSEQKVHEEVKEALETLRELIDRVKQPPIVKQSCFSSIMKTVKDNYENWRKLSSTLPEEEKSENEKKLIAMLDALYNAQTDRDFEEIFGLQPSYTEEDVDKRWKKVVLIAHTDKNKDCPELADNLFKLLSELKSQLKTNLGN